MWYNETLNKADIRLSYLECSSLEKIDGGEIAKKAVSY
jgi:hypothetical protein